VEGKGYYDYSIDGFNHQYYNVFSILNIDDYSEYVRDKNECRITTE
tara:strand:- start:1941 stop:2078 length:138 start_codon:yes stop_codon:yes gene_type:complete